MRKLKLPKSALSGSQPNPGDFPLGSIESRAAARAAIPLEPCFNILFDRGGGDQPGRRDIEMHFAQLDDRHGPVYKRLPGETLKEFTSRVVNMPGRKPGGLITYYYATDPRLRPTPATEQPER